MDNTAPQLDLDACAREPIRFPGAIQPHGSLLVVDDRELRLLHRSSNAQAMLGTKASVGASLEEAFGPSMTRDVRLWRDSGDPLFLRTVRTGERHFQLSAHRSPQGIHLEFEAAPADESETLEAVYPRLRAFVDAIGRATSVHDIAQLAVQEIQALTRFNRVMLYSFDAEGDGTVLTEASDGSCRPTSTCGFRPRISRPRRASYTSPIACGSFPMPSTRRH